MVVLASSLLLCGFAAAQSIPAVANALKATAPDRAQLSAAGKNLNQMVRTLQSPQRENAADIVSLVEAFRGAMTEALAVATLLVEMKCPADVATAQGSFGGSATHVVKMADIVIEAINRDLTGISNPAALAEATKVRDSIYRLGDTMQPFAAGE